MGYDKYYKKTKVKIDRDQNQDVKESATIDRTIYVLLVATLLLVPLFIKAHIAEFISPKLTFLSSGMQADIFSYYKYIFLIIFTVVIGILFMYKVLFLQYEIPKNKINLFLAILAVVVVLSAVFSPYKSLALNGMYNRHEGTIAYICYFVLFFVAANMKFSAKQLHGFLYTLYPFVLINTWLGLSLFNGKDLLQVEWIKNFILGAIPEGAQVSAGATLWATVSNPNYISGIASVLAVLFLTWAIFDKNKIRSAINVGMAILSFSMVLASLSTSGFLTVLVLLPIIIVFSLFNKQRVQSLIVLLAFIILASSVYIPMANKNSVVWTETFGFFVNENPFLKPVEASLNNEGNIFQKGLATIFNPSIAYANESTIESKEKFEIPTLPAAGMSAGSGRAYIWEKTFETAMKRPIFGYGLDTFPYIYPQDDIDKQAGLGYYWIVVDKPHNMYLGLLIGSGVVALIAFILLVGSILLKAVRSFSKKDCFHSGNAITLSLCAATIAYMIQGLMNDSVIGTAVIFWILLGILVSQLNRIKEK